jgi:hypothetical protein
MPTKMIRVLTAFLIFVFSVSAHAETRRVFSAKVIRIEPWMPIRITCGVALVTRLAEYEVKTVFRGHVRSARVIVRHLACNGDELDNLEVGDAVILVVRPLKVPERRVWHTWSMGGDKGPEISVRLDAVQVAKQIYPTEVKAVQP